MHSFLNDMFWVAGRRKTLSALVDVRVETSYTGLWLGRFWGSINYILMVLTMTVVYSAVLGADPYEYFPHLALGLALWNLISAQMTDSCRSVKDNLNLAQEFPFPPTLYFAVTNIVAAKNFLEQGLISLIGSILALGLMDTPLPYLQAVFGAVIAFVACGLFGLFIGIIATALQDISHLLKAILRIAFLVTPIIWQKDMRPIPSWIYNDNPFYHLIELFRAPLMGDDVAALSYWVAISMIFISLILCSIAYPSFRKTYLLWINR